MKTLNSFINFLGVMDMNKTFLAGGPLAHLAVVGLLSFQSVLLVAAPQANSLFRSKVCITNPGASALTRIKNLKIALLKQEFDSGDEKCDDAAIEKLGADTETSFFATKVDIEDLIKVESQLCAQVSLEGIPLDTSFHVISRIQLKKGPLPKKLAAQPCHSEPWMVYSGTEKVTQLSPSTLSGQCHRVDDGVKYRIELIQKSSTTGKFDDRVSFKDLIPSTPSEEIKADFSGLVTGRQYRILCSVFVKRADDSLKRIEMTIGLKKTLTDLNINWEGLKSPSFKSPDEAVRAESDVKADRATLRFPADPFNLVKIWCKKDGDALEQLVATLPKLSSSFEFNEYSGKPLRSGTTYSCRAQIADEKDDTHMSNKTPPIEFQTKSKSGFYKGVTLVNAFGETPSSAPGYDTGRRVEIAWRPFSKDTGSTLYRVLRTQRPNTGAATSNDFNFHTLDICTDQYKSDPSNTTCIACDHAAIGAGSGSKEVKKCVDRVVARVTDKKVKYDYVVAALATDPAGELYVEEVPYFKAQSKSTFDANEQLFVPRLDSAGVNALSRYRIGVEIPPANMALVQRDSANFEMCHLLGSRDELIDPLNHNRCPYNGPGAIPPLKGSFLTHKNITDYVELDEQGNAKNYKAYDFGYNFMIHRFEGSCQVTNDCKMGGVDNQVCRGYLAGVSEHIFALGLETSQGLGSAVAVNSDSALAIGFGKPGSVFQSTKSGLCYVRLADVKNRKNVMLPVWRRIDNVAQFNINSAKFLSAIKFEAGGHPISVDYSPKSSIDIAKAVCDRTDTPYGTMRLMSRREYLAAAAWPTQDYEITSNSDASIVDLEKGVAAKGCRWVNIAPVGGYAGILPQDDLSSEKCVSRAGVHHLVGSISEPLSDTVNCDANKKINRVMVGSFNTCKFVPQGVPEAELEYKDLDLFRFDGSQGSMTVSDGHLGRVYRKTDPTEYFIFPLGFSAKTVGDSISFEGVELSSRSPNSTRKAIKNLQSFFVASTATSAQTFAGGNARNNTSGNVPGRFALDQFGSAHNASGVTGLRCVVKSQ